MVFGLFCGCEKMATGACSDPLVCITLLIFCCTILNLQFTWQVVLFHLLHVSDPCFTTDQSALSPGSSSDTITTNLVYNSKHLGDPVSSGSLLTSVQHFPERSDKPECRYYMKTGSCKYGSTCKYHHPKERHVPLATGTLSPQGLPLRPVNLILILFLFPIHLMCFSIVFIGTFECSQIPGCMNILAKTDYLLLCLKIHEVGTVIPTSN